MAGNQLSGQLPFFNPIPDGFPKNSREKLLDNWRLFALEENGELNKAELNSLPHKIRKYIPAPFRPRFTMYLLKKVW